MKIKSKVGLIIMVPIVSFSSTIFSSCGIGDDFLTYCVAYYSGQTDWWGGAQMCERFYFDGYFYEKVSDDERKKFNYIPEEELIGYIYNEATYEVSPHPDESLIQALDPDNSIIRYDCKNQEFNRNTYMYLLTIEGYDWSEYLYGSLFDDADTIHTNVYYRLDKCLLTK
ncbi:MAG: hypothetical protein LUD22_02190 [Coprobacillus sp.]|nr:hypothetical protein [Coprobacillus sp.]